MVSGRELSMTTMYIGRKAKNNTCSSECGKNIHINKGKREKDEHCIAIQRVQKYEIRPTKNVADFIY